MSDMFKRAYIYDKIDELHEKKTNFDWLSVPKLPT